MATTRRKSSCRGGAERRRRAPLLAALLLALPLAAVAQWREETLSLKLDSGRVLDVRVKRPPDAAQRLPVLILFGGFQRGARALDLIRLDQPALLVTFEYPFDAPRKFMFPSSLRYLPEFRVALRETLEGIDALTAALRARADVDAARMSIVGASAGAPFAIIGAQQNAIPGLIVVQGFGQVRKVIAQQFMLKWEPKYGAWLRPLAWLLAAGVVCYADVPEAADHAPHMSAAQKVLMIATTEDQRIPPEATENLWRALQQSPARSTRLDLPGRHLHGDADEQIADILQRSVEWLRREKLL